MEHSQKIADACKGYGIETVLADWLSPQDGGTCAENAARV